MRRILLFALLAATAPAAAQSPDALFQQALRMERVQGDFRGAIGLYEQIAQAPAADRTTVAKALVQMGKAYESLGRTEAFSVYERVVRDYSDQADEVAEARGRMAGLASPAPSATDRAENRVLYNLPYFRYPDSNAPVDLYGAAPSSTGRLLVRQTGLDAQIVVDDLQTGEQEIFDFSDAGCDGSFITSRFSPDDRMLAVSCWESIYLIDRATKAVTRLVEGSSFLGVSAELHFEAEVYDWTDDGKYVLASVQGWNRGDPDSKHWVALIPVAGGEPKIIDDEYWGDTRDFREMNACVMNGDSIMFGEYTVEEGEGADTRERIQIRLLGVGTDREEVALGDALYDYELFGCDRSQSAIIYSRKTSADRQLWAAQVGQDGSLSQHRFLQSMPSDADPVMSQTGDLYYTQNLSGEWMAVEAKMDATGSLVGDPRITGESWFVHRYAPNGAYVAEEGPSGLSYFGTPAGLRDPLLFTEGYAAQVAGVTGNNFIFRRNDEGDHTTWLISAEDGAVLDSLPGVWARWISQDLKEIYRLEQIENDRCLVREERGSGEYSTLFCNPDRGFQTEFDPEYGHIAVWSRDPERFHVEYFNQETGTFTTVIDRERGWVMVRWAGGKLYLKDTVGTNMMRFDPETGETESLSVLEDLHERGIYNSSNQFGIKLDGSAFQTHYRIFPPGKSFDLFVARDPLGLK